MINDGRNYLAVASKAPHSLKERLADFLTLSRGVIGLVILSLSFIGSSAYLTVVILALVGGATDILDGKVARRYLGDGKEGKLGRHDIEIDTLFILCIIGYLSFSEIVIPTLAGLGWIALAITGAFIYKRKAKVLVMIEVPSVIGMLVVAALYNLQIFIFIILPIFAIGLVLNRRRVLYIIFEYWPKIFSQ